ncbi:MAG: hypothetical protein L3K17_00900 [Thermoplasmata archaeon]|nr:hypothetical protein [Thermoplasmata archaeon]
MYPPPGVEDPISAIFDLSDRVAAMAPTMRRMYRYTATVVVLFLLIMVILLFVGLADNLVFALMALIALVFGGIALSLLRETDRFYASYLGRHRAIKLIQDADPAPKIPAGRTPVERLARYLGQSSARIKSFLDARPEALRYRVTLPAKGGDQPFDLVILSPGSSLYRWFGWGDPGFAAVARLAPETLTPMDVARFASDLQSIARRLPARLVRAILLRPQPGPVSEAVYDLAVGHPVEVPGGPVAIEIVTEQPNGTYDLVPHVLGVP